MANKQETTIRTMQAVVVKIVDDNTIIVEVETKRPHPLYKKIVKSHKKYMVHKEADQEVAVKQVVIIESCRPMSKRKTWKLSNMEVKA